MSKQSREGVLTIHTDAGPLKMQVDNWYVQTPSRRYLIRRDLRAAWLGLKGASWFLDRAFRHLFKK